MTKIHIFQNYELLLFSVQDAEFIERLPINNFHGFIDKEDLFSILFEKAFVTGNVHTIQLLQIAISDLHNYSKRIKMRAYAELVSEI